MPPPSGLSEAAELPEGTVTFLFSDVEGSTQLLEAYGDASGAALLRHHQLFELVIAGRNGAIFETVGDAVYAAFASAPDAVAAALDIHRALAAEGWEDIGGRLACRIALHTGAVERRGDHYFGPPLFRCARLEALAYGGQTVVSAATAALTGTQLPPGARLIDRGVHQLKDLQEPEHVFELQHPDLQTDFPPLKSLSARPHNLPVQLSTFVGRAGDLDAVGGLIQAHRLVTLLGPGGMGKTRLALQAAADQIDAFPDGAWFVDLSAVRAAGDIPAQIAGAMRLPEDAETPAEQTLGTHLRDRKLLIVLDNLEQLLPDAARSTANLMSQSNAVHVLATSRRPLRIRGEVEYILEPLGAGDLQRLDHVVPDAVALFLARGREIRPDLEIDAETGPLIAGICRQLDGLPLAIELAAARLRLFGLKELHDRLARRLATLVGGAVDLPDRQQTLQATIAWSDELLGDAERTLFYRLGAYPDAFGLEGARAVVPEASEVGVETDLTALIEHSLVRRRQAGTSQRFAMLETVREFAHGQLMAAGQHDVTASLIADFHLGLATGTRDQLIGHGQLEALHRLSDEFPNMRASLQWLRDHGDERLSLLVASLGRFWGRAGFAREGMQWVENAASQRTSTSVQAMLLQLRGSLLADSSPHRAAEAYEAAITAYEQDGNLTEIGRSQLGLSNALFNAGELDGALVAARSAQANALETGDRRTEAAAIGNAANIALQIGRLDEAEAEMFRAVDMFQSIGDVHGLVIGLGNLGEIAARRGNGPEALSRHERGVDAARALGDPGLLGWELTNVAGALATVGRLREAPPLLIEGLQKLDEANDVRSVISAMAVATTLLAAAGDADGAADTWMLAQSLSRSQELPIEDWLAEQAQASLSVPTDPKVGRDPTTVDAAMQRVISRLRDLAQ